MTDEEREAAQVRMHTIHNEIGYMEAKLKELRAEREFLKAQRSFDEFKFGDYRHMLEKLDRVTGNGQRKSFAEAVSEAETDYQAREQARAEALAEDEDVKI